MGSRGSAPAASPFWRHAGGAVSADSADTGGSSGSVLSQTDDSVCVRAAAGSLVIPVRRGIDQRHVPASRQ